jgi:outer membrane autotransporter protein
MNFSDGVIDGGSTGFALNVTGAQAVINRSTIRGMGTALNIHTDLNNPVVSRVEVNDSVIEGGDRGAIVAPENTLILNNSEVSGATQSGVLLSNSTVVATGSRISGQTSGVSVFNDPIFPNTPSTLELNGTEVIGHKDAAIKVDSGAILDIQINNGTTLTGGDGNVLEVDDGTARVTVNNSQLTGNVQATDGSTLNLTLQNGASLTGQMTGVDSLALNSGGRWNMVDNASVGALSMNGGAVKFGEPNAYYQLNVDSLSGNGNFIMDVDFVTGEHDFLNVQGQATGTHTLLIGSSGADPVSESQMHVVHTGGGDAQFSLLNGPVDLGAFSYDLMQSGNDWYLDTTSKVISPGTRSVLALFNTAPTVWYGELSTLRSRMGELRMDGGQAGGWMRTYGNKYDVSAASGVGYKQSQQGLSFGADAPLPMGDGQWLVGLMGGYSKSDLDLQRGTSGEVASFYVGAYTTWLDADSGYYIDGLVKLNQFQNESNVQLSDGTKTKGDYKNSGLGASLELGRNIKLDDGYFIEPYTQLSGVIIQGKDYDLDNGLKAEGDRTNSLLGKVGATVGRNFDMGNGRFVQPYVRAAYAHEFAKNNEVQVNNNVFNNDLSGSRAELGAGLSVQLAESLQAHVDLDYSNGDNIEQPWGANFGLRYSW